jgi:hypothetical protein
MTTSAILSSESDEKFSSASLWEEGGHDGGRGRNTFFRRSVALISAVSVFGLTALGIMTLGTLAGTDTPTVAHSRVVDNDSEA